MKADIEKLDISIASEDDWWAYYEPKNHPDSLYIYYRGPLRETEGWFEHKFSRTIFRRTRGKMDCEGAD